MNKSLLAFLTFFVPASVALAQPVITQNPQNATVCLDSCATFSVSAVGNGLTYVWMMEDSLGQVSSLGSASTLQLCDSIVQYDGGLFYCKVFDQSGDSAVSSSATLIVDSCLAPVADFYWDWSPTEICFTSTSSNAETLFWLFGDGTTNSANMSEICHTYETDEIYFIKLIAYNDYGQDEIEKPINLLSVQELSSEINVFPNPTSSYITLQSDKQIETVRIFNVQGVLVNSIQVNALNTSLSLEDLKRGVYTALISIEGEVMQHRIVKQ